MACLLVCARVLSSSVADLWLGHGLVVVVRGSACVELDAGSWFIRLDGRSARSFRHDGCVSVRLGAGDHRGLFDGWSEVVLRFGQSVDSGSVSVSASSVLEAVSGESVSVSSESVSVSAGGSWR